MPKPTKRKRRKRRVIEPLTEELLEQLLASDDPARFASENRIETRSLADHLNALLDEKGMQRAQVVHEAGLNDTFGYQIFTGARNPSRDKLLQLVFAMKCTLKEANRLLQAGGHSALYCKNRRDAIIIFCLDRGMSLLATDQELYRFGEATIC